MGGEIDLLWRNAHQVCVSSRPRDAQRCSFRWTAHPGPCISQSLDWYRHL